MKIVFLESFSKDLDKLNNSDIKLNVLAKINEIDSAKRLNSISNLKKLKGFKNAYRLKLGDYRIGLYFENWIVEFARILHRKEIYRIFP